VTLVPAYRGWIITGLPGRVPSGRCSERVATLCSVARGGGRCSSGLPTGRGGLCPSRKKKPGGSANRVRQQIIALLYQSKESRLDRRPAEEGAPLPEVQARLDAVEDWLAAVEQRVGTGPDTSDLDEQIDRVRRERLAAASAQEDEQAAALRNREKELLADKAVRREEWTAQHPALPVLAERVQQLADETERLRALLRQHGIDPQDKPT
jgi:hypothetical protein